jgi:succinate dehydrogenase hydrophobic anchor subunit
MYNASHYDMSAPLGKVLLITAVILVLLFAVRFLNLTLVWNVTRLEVTKDPLTKVGDYKFLGLSGYEAAREKLKNTLTLHAKKTIISYFDLLHPAVFLIHCSETNTFVNLGITTVYLQPGTTAVSFYATEIIETKRNGEQTGVVYYGSSLFPSLYEKLANYISGSGGGKEAPRISFVLKEIEDAAYLKIPYYLYFYLPLLVILTLGGRYGLTFYISFIYYLGLFLLFDFKKVLFTVPFSWLINLLGLKISPTTAAIVSAVVLIPFVFGIFAGILHSRKQDPLEKVLTSWGKGFIVFFILLPLALRF